MKKFNLFGLALVTTMANFTACNNDAEEILTQECEIRLTSEITPSRVANPELQSTQIVSGRQVGVTINNAQTAHNNVAWSVGNTGQLINTGDAIYYGDGAATITAYHPYNPTWTSTSHEFSVSTDQTEAAEYLNSDLLWATASSSKTENAIKLEFTHKLAKINVTLVPEKNGDDLNGATISICNTKISTTFNPSTGDITDAAGEPQEIIANVTTNNVYTASAIIIPQDVNGKFIKITLGDKTYYYTLASSTTLEAGYSYNYTLTLKGKQLINTESGIGPWENGGDKTGDAEEDVEVSKSVTLTIAGTLSTLISEEEKYNITSLTISGPLNGDDIAFLRDIIAYNSLKEEPIKGKITMLDLSNASIVAGGGVYDKNWSTASDHYTENNIIGDNMFENCRNLETLKIPNTITKIGQSGFSNCYSLKSFEIPSSVTSIGNDAFFYCSNIRTINIPSQVTKIDNQTFAFCSSLETVTIPANVTEIGSSAFGYCDKLLTIHCKASTPPTLSTNTFTNTTRTSGTLYVPIASLTKYQIISNGNLWYLFSNIVGE